jgi:hypothetical protein
MNINELRSTIQDLINQAYTVDILLNELNNESGLKAYNQKIRVNVHDLPGIYIWENHDTNEILYIGMAGKINQQGQLNSHSIRKRLQASRGKDKLTKKDIQTNSYILELMNQENCPQLNIHILHFMPNQLPGYAEAILLNAFYQRNGCLPKYNSAF